MLILLLKFTVKSKCNYAKFVSGASWIQYNLWKPPSKNPGYAPVNTHTDMNIFDKNMHSLKAAHQPLRLKLSL